LARGAVQLHLARLPRLLRLGLVAPGTPAGHAGHSVDVFVATYDEPLEVLEATLAGCAALSYPHETFLLDDGRRWEMAALAAEWGAQWITRPDNSHAKAATSTTPFPAPAAS
jgi:cellulose synthase/poly-beta-1,6-N-acetylglucosamine synthase-like glycosyltransferase